MRYIGILLVVLIISGCHHNVKKSDKNPSYMVETVEAVGMSPIGEYDIQSVRNAALNDALKRAVDLVVGIYLSANSVVSKSILIDDEIRSKTEGYVEKYEIIKEYQEGNFYYVKIKARVRKEDLAAKLRNVENEVEKIGSPVIYLKIVDETQPSFNGAENSFISEFKKDLFRLSSSSDSADVIIDARVNTSFNTSEGIGGFISYSCYIEGRIYTIDGEPAGGFTDRASGIGLSDMDARNNASIACVRKVYSSVKDSIIRFYSAKKTLTINIENVSSVNEVNEIIKFFKNIPAVRNVYVKNYDINKCIIELVMHKGKADEISSLMAKSGIFDVKRVHQFTIEAAKR